MCTRQRSNFANLTALSSYAEVRFCLVFCTPRNQSVSPHHCANSVLIHVSAFITSQDKTPAIPGGQVQQALVSVFQNPICVWQNPNTDSKPSATRSLLLRDRSNFCFSLIDHCFFSSHHILLTSSLTNDQLSCRVSLRFAKDSAQGNNRALPLNSFCVSPSNIGLLFSLPS